MNRTPRTTSLRPAGLAAVLGAAALAAGCAAPPRADRIVYVSEAPAAGGTVFERETVYERDPLGAPAARDRDDVSEADRRKWVEENYGASRAPAAAGTRRVVVRERYVPRVEVVRERVAPRVVYVERDPRWYDYVPPVTFGLSYWGGRGHHGHGRGGWSWGLGWAWPAYRW